MIPEMTRPNDKTTREDNLFFHDQVLCVPEHGDQEIPAIDRLAFFDAAHFVKLLVHTRSIDRRCSQHFVVRKASLVFGSFMMAI